jgi:hypothetical protein
MRRCTSCFKWATGFPTYCPSCGRTYNVKICSRGHVCLRSVEFCPTCGSSEMSTPAAPEGLLSRLSHWSVAFFFWLFFVVLGLSVAASLLASLDWRRVGPALTEFALVVALLYWASTLLPGPVKRVGRAAGRGVVRAVRRARDQRASRR